MNGWRARSFVGPLLPALLASLLNAPAARAQAGDAEADRREALIAQTRSNIERNIDLWVFGRPRLQLANGDNEAHYVLKARLAVEIEDLERVCGITSAQKKKLEAAGRGDIKRFFDRVAKVKDECLAHVDGTRPNELALALQKIQPVRDEFQMGILGEGSFYHKVLEATLSPDQIVQREKEGRERFHYEYQASLGLTLEMLNEQVGFTQDQAEQLLELVRKETRPPLALGKQEYYAVLYGMSAVPEVKLKAIFDEAQYRCLKQQLDQARGLGAWLKTMGFVPAEGAPTAAPAAGPTRRKAVEAEKLRGIEIKAINRRAKANGEKHRDD